MLSKAVAARERDARASNRYLRAALLCLFAHLEGVINQIFLERRFRGIGRQYTLSERIERISAEARKHGCSAVLNIRLGKAFRDILVHPGIEKQIGTKKLTEISLFDYLSPEILRKIGTDVSRWLDLVCQTLGVIRFTDTKSMVENLSASLGPSEGVKEV